MKKIARLATAFALGVLSLSSYGATFVGDRTDFRDETIYFAMTTRFYDGDPKNNVLSWDKQDVQISKNDPDWRGDFAGLIEKLDYIKALGFTAVWITPIVQNASGEDYHGYHAMDFKSVDLRYESRKEWGSAKDVKFQDLINAAHAKGMKIILDIVLNHTGNFGEVTLNPLFTRDQNIKNQASPETSLIPNPDRFGDNYFDQDGNAQYQERFKYFKNPNYDVHNYYHHYGTGWNWDEPNRWWGQIAGDCVDLNTENDVVAQHLVNCYGEFIKMGVDGFRIDTTGHISRLTFNTQFIPQFLAIAEQYKSKRLNGCPFFMFGECCARFGGVVYRDQHNLSSHFYTWKSDQSLIDQFKAKSTQAFWDTQKLNEGHDTPVGPMITCESEKAFNKNSNNVFMVNGAWHEPDYSQYSGFSVIDFPMHYNFNNAASAVNIAKEGDKYYNDASYNVVYVDSHDYCPGPNDGTRFNGGTAQWAENLSLMFTFRGIPCIYYGSEVEFKKGKPIDVGGENNKTPRSESGRAYFGAYLEGSVTTTDFGQYNASGNVSKTLNADLAQHIRRLNLIRAAVPALRKGQYTWDGCSASGGWAFKRAYKDSYALVCINGGATFTGVPSGTYVDLVTGQKYTPSNGSITVSAPTNKGQLRVLVKDWSGGKVGEDGKFIYSTSSVAKGGSVEFTDPGTTSYYTKKDAVARASVVFSPAGGTFKTETQTVTASLSESATSGWYQVAGQAKVTLSKGASKSFTIGSGMSFGQSVSVTWGAIGEDGNERTGTVNYKKVDPNASISVYVTCPAGVPNFYAWKDSKELCGKWPGEKPSQSVEIDGTTYYYMTFDDVDSFNIIFNLNGQTGDITGIDEDKFFSYDGGSGYKELENVQVNNDPHVSFSPNGGEFYNTINVTATAKNATSAWYKIGSGAQTSFTSTATFSLGANMSEGQSVTVSWSATGAEGTKTGSVTFTKVAKPEGITIYYDNSVTNWSTVKVHHWSVNETTWPGVDMAKVSDSRYSSLWKYTVPEGTSGVVFNNGNGDQTDNVESLEHNRIYKGTGNRKWEKGELYSAPDMSGVDGLEVNEVAPVEIYNLQGIRVDNPSNGIYIIRQGNSVRKVFIR